MLSYAVPYLVQAVAMAVARMVQIGWYLQQSVLFYAAGFLPFLLVWCCCGGARTVLLLLGYDAPASHEGQAFAIPYAIGILLGGVTTAFQEMLDVVELQIESTILTMVGAVAKTAAVGGFLLLQQQPLPLPLLPGTPTLVELGWVFLVVDALYLGVVLGGIWGFGWLEEYYEGFFSTPWSAICGGGNSNNDNSDDNNDGGDPRRSPAAIRLMLSNAITYAFSTFVVHGEWQAFLFFSSVLGPAEVAAWGLLGVIWEELEEIVTAIAEGCVIRCTVCLGLGDVPTAKLVAYKSLWICFVWGVAVTTVFVLFANEIPGLLTNDEVLQAMVAKNIPMMSVANTLSGLGIMADQILSAQNRVVLQTQLGVAATIFVTLPLGAISSLVFRLDLEGLTGAISIGFAVFSAMAMHAVILSDWKAISAGVLSIHGYSVPSSSSNSIGNDSASTFDGDRYDWCELPPPKQRAAALY
eukprot:jgi/Psemu1/291187/fgenesh1_pg.644_\